MPFSAALLTRPATELSLTTIPMPGLKATIWMSILSLPPAFSSMFSASFRACSQVSWSSSLTCRTTLRLCGEASAARALHASANANARATLVMRSLITRCSLFRRIRYEGICRTCKLMSENLSFDVRDRVRAGITRHCRTGLRDCPHIVQGLAAPVKKGRAARHGKEAPRPGRRAGRQLARVTLLLQQGFPEKLADLFERSRFRHRVRRYRCTAGDAVL